MPAISFGIGVAGDDDLLVRLDQRVEQVEELLLRAALAAEELDVVDQQQVERPVMPLEFVEGLVLVRAHHVGDVGLGVDVADLGRRVLRQDVVADGLDQVGLAQSDAAVHEQRVVGCRVVGHLQAGGPGQLVGLAGHERREIEARIEAGGVEFPGRSRRLRGHPAGRGEVQPRRAIHRGGRWGGRGRDRRRPGPFRAGFWAAAAASTTANSMVTGAPVASRARASMRLLNRSRTHCRTKRLGATQLERSALVRTGERAYPRRELLRRQFALEGGKAQGPGRGKQVGVHAAYGSLGTLGVGQTSRPTASAGTIAPRGRRAPSGCGLYASRCSSYPQDFAREPRCRRRLVVQPRPPPIVIARTHAAQPVAALAGIDNWGYNAL